MRENILMANYTHANDCYADANCFRDDKTHFFIRIYPDGVVEIDDTKSSSKMKIRYKFKSGKRFSKWYKVNHCGRIRACICIKVNVIEASKYIRAINN